MAENTKLPIPMAKPVAPAVPKKKMGLLKKIGVGALVFVGILVAYTIVAMTVMKIQDYREKVARKEWEAELDRQCAMTPAIKIAPPSYEKISVDHLDPEGWITKINGAVFDFCEKHPEGRTQFTISVDTHDPVAGWVSWNEDMPEDGKAFVGKVSREDFIKFMNEKIAGPYAVTLERLRLTKVQDQAARTEKEIRDLGAYLEKHPEALKKYAK